MNPDLFQTAREMLTAAGFDTEDPECRALVALVNLGCRKSNCDVDRFPDKKAHAAHRSRMSYYLRVIRKLVVEAKMAGVTDKHLSTVPCAAADSKGKRAWGELQHHPEHGWRYIPPGKSYLEIRATHRLAVISGLQSAIWAADVEGRKVRGRRRRRIITSTSITSTP